MNVDRIPEGIYDCMDFRGFSASADPDMLVDVAVFRPLFAPALCWCAHTQLLSTPSSCRSASMPSSCNIFSNSPVFCHSLNRPYTVPHAPYRSGRSRHGAPVRMIHTTPFSACLSSLLGLPSLPDRRPGKYFSNRSHSCSVNSCRLCEVMSITSFYILRHASPIIPLV